jgi:transcriptional regulator with XRE-family HTH domain
MALILGECLLREIRELKGMSQQELSDKLFAKYEISISDTMISKYERGLKYPNPLVSRAICKVLGCVESELYDFLEA